MVAALSGKRENDTMQREFVASAQCPLYTQKRTCAVQLGMSALGQKRTWTSVTCDETWHFFSVEVSKQDIRCRI